MLQCSTHSSETDSALQCCGNNFESSANAKSRSRMKVPAVWSKVPDTWTADAEGALPELSPCPPDKLVQFLA